MKTQTTIIIIGISVLFLGISNLIISSEINKYHEGYFLGCLKGNDVIFTIDCEKPVWKVYYEKIK